MLAAGVVLTGSTPVYDLVRETVYRRDEGQPLRIPRGQWWCRERAPSPAGTARNRGYHCTLRSSSNTATRRRNRRIRLEDLLR